MASDRNFKTPLGAKHKSRNHILAPTIARRSTGSLDSSVARAFVTSSTKTLDGIS